MVVKLTKLTKLTQKSLRYKNGYFGEIKNPPTLAGCEFGKAGFGYAGPLKVTGG